MSKEQFIALLLKKPYMFEMGAGKLGKMYDLTREEVYEAKELAKKKRITAKLPRILLLDIETTPLEAYVWQTQVWKARVGDESVISRWFMLTWSAKWLFAPETMSMKLNREEVLEENDSRIVRGLWEVLNLADIVIAHNGDSFDVPNINTRFIVNGLPPTKPYQTIDTLRIAQRQFGFSHNSLNALANVFNLEGKSESGYKLWRECKNGNEEALARMEDYNRQDVSVLEEVYLKIRPWIKGHPNLGLYMELDVPVCKNCGSTDIYPDGNFYYTSAGKFETFKCECGAVGRSRFNSFPKGKRRSLIV
jgi:DNA polymerase elongation subunit (family B)